MAITLKPNTANPQYQTPPFYWGKLLSVPYFKKEGIRKECTGELKSFCHRYLRGEGLLCLLCMYWLQNVIQEFVSKGDSQSGCFKKTKRIKLSEKRTLLIPWYAHVRTFLTAWYAHTRLRFSGGKKCLFFGKFDVLCFLETPVLRFALLP